MSLILLKDGGKKHCSSNFSLESSHANKYLDTFLPDSD